MPLPAFFSKLKKHGWRLHSLHSMPVTTGGSTLITRGDDGHTKVPSSATTSLDSKTELNASSVTHESKTLGYSGGGPNAHPRAEPSLATTPTNSPRHSQGDGEKVALKEHTLPADELKERLANVVAPTKRSLGRPTHRPRSFTHALRNGIRPLVCGLACHLRPSFRVDQDALLVCSLSHHLFPEAPCVAWDVTFCAGHGVDKYTEYRLNTICSSVEDCLQSDFDEDASLSKMASSYLRDYKTLEEAFAQKPTPDNMTTKLAVCRLQRYCEAWTDMAIWQNKSFDQALSFFLAKCLGTLGIAPSLEAIRKDKVRVLMNVGWEFERRRRQPISRLLANYNGPSGRQSGPDIDDETDSDSDSEDDSDTSGYFNGDIDADETDSDGDLENDINGDGNPDPSLLLMGAIYIDQLFTKAPFDLRRDLEGLRASGLQAYTHELVERIRKHLVLPQTQTGGTKAILNTALSQYQKWSQPLRSIEDMMATTPTARCSPIALEELIAPLQIPDRAKTALGEWFCLLRLLAQRDVRPSFHFFAYSSGDIGKAFISLLKDFTAAQTAKCVVNLDRELLMACALRHRALIDARHRLGHSVDAKIRYVWSNIAARRPGLDKRWVIGETERLLPGLDAPSELGDAERIELCQKALKLRPFALLEERYPGVEIWSSHELAINMLQHIPCFQTDLLALSPQNHGRAVCLYYCTLVLATLGFEPPMDLHIEFDYLLALIRREVERRDRVKRFLMMPRETEGRS